MRKWTRRGFIAAGIAAGGAFTVGVAVREGHRAPKLAGMMTDSGETLVNVWVKLAEDNTVTAIVPHAEMGQGVFTAMAQMLAEEMDADWERVTFEQAPAHEAYANFPLAREYFLGDVNVPGFVQDSLNGGFLRISQSMALQITGGSTSVRFTGQGGMRIAGAAAKDMLTRAAANEWGVSASDIRTEKSFLYHDASGRSAPYSAFARAASELTPPTQPALKQEKDYQLMGQSLPRFDIPSKVDGTALFAIDVELPNMRYAAVRGAPVFGAVVEQLDASRAENMAGVEAVFNEGDYVAVVAGSYWHAERAVRALEVTWSQTDKDGLTQPRIFDTFREDMTRAVENGDEVTDFETGDARGALNSASRRVEAEYQVPYLAHAAMEPLNAVARVANDQVELWVGHQNPLGVRNDIAEHFGFDTSKITLHHCLMGGAFGRKSEADFPRMAVRIAQQTDGPVKLIWSREQDTQQDFYRPASVARVIAGLNADGTPSSWDYQFVHKQEPVEASHVPYDIPHQLVHYAESENPVRFGPWRSVDHTQHGFFIESFIDELAHAAKEDPLTYRQNLLATKPRYLKVLEAVAQMSQWGRSMPAGHGLGVAVVESFGTVVAQVVEVDASGSELKVPRVWAAADPGFVVNPDGFTAQIESGVVYGLSAALYGDISVQDGAIAQSNFHDYPVVRMHESPRIEVTLINSGARLGGGGEPGTPPIAPAVTNAIFAATGERVRALPIVSKPVRES